MGGISKNYSFLTKIITFKECIELLLYHAIHFKRDICFIMVTL